MTKPADIAVCQAVLTLRLDADRGGNTKKEGISRAATTKSLKAGTCMK